jgi:hypothetical protein
VNAEPRTRIEASIPRAAVPWATAGLLLYGGASMAAEDSWFADLERYTRLRDIHLDVAAPESASFTALGVAPFITAQALASPDLSFSASQVFDDFGNPRAAVGIDFAPTLLSRPELTLQDYQRTHRQRTVSRLQLSLAVSHGESAQDSTTRVAPTLRIVFHEQRDPRVHRGPGSLQDCFERNVPAPENPANDSVEEQKRYLETLKQAAEQGMKACRDDPEVAAYTWNATGFAVGISPSFRDDLDDIGALKPKGVLVYATQSFGFDSLGRLPTYMPTFLGSHAQVLAQVLFRYHEPLEDRVQPRSYLDANELVGSVRLRGGSSRLSGNLEAAVIHDWLPMQRNDVLTRLSIGLDAHVARGTWLTLSVGRTLWREALPNHTSGGLGIKFTPLD